jgi:hypothetical protein
MPRASTEQRARVDVLRNEADGRPALYEATARSLHAEVKELPAVWLYDERGSRHAGGRAGRPSPRRTAVEQRIAIVERQFREEREHGFADLPCSSESGSSRSCVRRRARSRATTSSDGDTELGEAGEDERGDHRAFSNRGGHTLRRAVADVARGEEP